MNCPPSVFCTSCFLHEINLFVVFQALALACTTTPPNQSDPPEITDRRETMSPAEFKKLADEESLILKTTYWYVGLRAVPGYRLIRRQ